MIQATTATGTNPSRQAVLDAAHQLVRTRGYNGFSMRDLARESGLAKATIYHHFQDKQDVYFNVLEQDIIHAGDLIAAAAEIDGDWIERLRSVICTYFDLQTQRRALLMTAMRENSEMKEELFAIVKEHRHHLFRPVQKIIDQAQSQGILRPIDTEMAVISLFGMLNGFVAVRVFFEEGDIGDNEVEHTLQLFLHGIVAKT